MSRREQQFRYRLRRQTGMVILTVKVSHPLSALLALASWKVLLNTALSRESWGVGRGCGLRRVSSCFTADGRCLTIFSGESHAGGVDLMTWTLNVERLYSIYSESSSKTECRRSTERRLPLQPTLTLNMRHSHGLADV